MQAEEPEADKTAKKVFNWAKDGFFRRGEPSVGRITLINLVPLIAGSSERAVELIADLDFSLLVQIQRVLMKAMKLSSGGRICVVLAHSHLEGRRFQLPACSLRAELGGI